MSSSFRADANRAEVLCGPGGIALDATTEAPRQLAGRTLDRESGALEADEAPPPAALPSTSYGPEFWAKMSHELRSPLNSLLVLSQMLLDDAEQNLSAKQLAFAQTIHNSGNDLLALISDMVDLSKIDAHLLLLDPAELSLEGLRIQLLQTFEPLARTRGLQFSVELGAGVPRAVLTDARRLHQVLKNLILNAFDRSQQGAVKVSVGVASCGWTRQIELASRADEVIAFSVTDTGPCLSESDRQSSFESFHAPHGVNRRRSGRTGLGLTLSRELAWQLGGELSVESGAGGGNTFTLYLPSSSARAAASSVSQPTTSGQMGTAAVGTSSTLVETRRGLRVSPPGAERRVILMADPLLHATSAGPALERGLTAVSCGSLLSELGALARGLPAAIALDLSQQRLDDWVALDCLVSDLTTRAVPVLAVAPAQLRQRALALGAAAVAASTSHEHLAEALRELERYAPSEPRRVLLISQGRAAHAGVIELISAEGVEVSVVTSVRDALALLGRARFHACVLHLGEADHEGPGQLSGLAELAKSGAGGTGAELPIVVYAERSLGTHEAEQLSSCPGSSILKTAASRERLLHEVSIYVRCPESRYSGEQRRLLALGLRRAPELLGARVLLVDDDVRSVFALTSALERHGLVVSYADDAREALSKLDAEASLRAVLVNVSASRFQGDQLIRHIRQYRVHGQLPIIALGAPSSAAEFFRVPGSTYQIEKSADPRPLISALRIVAGRR